MTALRTEAQEFFRDLRDRICSRLEELDGKVARIRCYCFCPDTLRMLGQHLGHPALGKAYRSPGS